MEERTQIDLIEMFRKDTARLVEELRAEAEAEKASYRKCLVNGVAMLEQPSEGMETLLAPLLPRVGVAALAAPAHVRAAGNETVFRHECVPPYGFGRGQATPPPPATSICLGAEI